MTGLWQAADASEERLAAARRAAALCRRFGLPEREFDALFHQHEALRTLRRFAEDAAVLDRAEQLADQLGSPRRAGQVERWRGVAAMVQGDAPRARAAFERALALAERTGDLGNLTWSSNNLAILRMRAGDLAVAAGLFERARRGVRESGDVRLGAAMVDSNRAELLVAQGRLDEASAEARRALAVARELHHGDLQMQCLERLARVALERGDPEGAQGLLTEALALSDDEGFRMDLYPTLARVELSRGDLERARSWARRALTAADDQPPSLDQRLFGLYVLGEVEERSGRRAAARRHLDEALALTRESAMGLLGAGVRRALGRLERRRGNLEAAERLVLEALADHRGFGAELEAAHDLLELAEVQLATGAAAAGEESARQALAVYERLGAWAGAGAAAELLRRAPSATAPPPGSTVAETARRRPPW
jgi:tetratricopeptide (TPR) repeat protein